MRFETIRDFMFIWHPCQQSPAWRECYVNVWNHDDVIKSKRFPRYWPIVRGIHRWFSAQWPVTRGFDVFFDLRLNSNNREAGDLRRHRAHYDVSVMWARLPDHV